MGECACDYALEVGKKKKARERERKKKKKGGSVGRLWDCCQKESEISTRTIKNSFSGCYLILIHRSQSL